jgi:hypothetical protein
MKIFLVSVSFPSWPCCVSHYISILTFKTGPIIPNCTDANIASYTLANLTCKPQRIVVIWEAVLLKWTLCLYNLVEYSQSLYVLPGIAAMSTNLYPSQPRIWSEVAKCEIGSNVGMWFTQAGWAVRSPDRERERERERDSVQRCETGWVGMEWGGFS